MHIGFIIKSFDDIEPGKSSSLEIMRELMLRGHLVSLLYPNNLTVRNNIVHGFAKIIKKMDKIPDSTKSFYKKIDFDTKMVALHAYDSLFIRHDPPIDPILFNFLDSIKDETLIINDADGIRKANNKLYTTTFHDPNNTFLPVTHVSKNKNFLRRIIEESDHDKWILKPLVGSGGSGVIVLEKSAMSNVNSLLDFYIGEEQMNYVILQEYVEGAQEGDIRILMLNGAILGAYQRKPAEGEIRANIQAGGSAHKYTLSEHQKHICRKIGPKLIADGLYFVGLDMIGDKIIEVNVLNPGGITNINRLNKVKLQTKVVDFIEEKVGEREEKRAELEYLFKRLGELRTQEH